MGVPKREGQVSSLTIRGNKDDRPTSGFRSLGVRGGGCRYVLQSVKPGGTQASHRNEQGKRQDGRRGDQGWSVLMEVSTFRRYLSILESRVGREIPRSLAARVRLPLVRSRASRITREAKRSMQASKRLSPAPVSRVCRTPWREVPLVAPFC